MQHLDQILQTRHTVQLNVAEQSLFAFMNGAHFNKRLPYFLVHEFFSSSDHSEGLHIRKIKADPQKLLDFNINVSINNFKVERTFRAHTSDKMLQTTDSDESALCLIPLA